MKFLFPKLLIWFLILVAAGCQSETKPGHRPADLAARYRHATGTAAITRHTRRSEHSLAEPVLTPGCPSVTIGLAQPGFARFPGSFTLVKSGTARAKHSSAG
jgi:hypothetical protein